jgi:nucleoid-associated protein YgaU
MRKDVKFALIIGAVFLAVLIVYISVMQSGDKGRNDVTLVVPTGDSGSGAANMSSAAPTPPAKAPLRNSTPASVAPVATASDHPRNLTPEDHSRTAAPAVARSNDHSNAVAAAPRPQPVRTDLTPGTSAAPTGDPNADPWRSALNYGMLDTVKPAVDIRPDASNPPAPSVDAAPITTDTPGPDAQPIMGDISPAQPSTPIPTPEVAIGPTPAIPTTVTPSVPLSPSAAAAALSAPASPAAPTTHPVQANTGARTHVVASGETYSSIALSVYGTSKYWNRIADANPNIDPKNLRPGMTLIIPAFSPTIQPAVPAAVAAPAQPAIDPKTEYRVQSGDSLYKIAIHLFNDGKMSDKIYEMNKALIGPDPAKLKVGMVLKLPAATAPAAAAPAPK